MDRELIKIVPKLALLEMGLHLKRQKTTDGWLYFTKGVGNFGTDYLLRGMANLLGPGGTDRRTPSIRSRRRTRTETNTTAPSTTT